MKTEKRSFYKGTMVVLYMVCRFGWNLYLKYWERFAGLSDEYTKEFGTAMLKTIEDTQAMPDISQRRGSVKQSGNELDASSLAGLMFWKKLRRFIIKAIPAKADQKTAIALAGGAHFAKAGSGNYAEITELLIAGKTYLANNADMLIAKASMPATFAGAYGKAKDDYDSEHLQYGESKGDSTTEGNDKVTANNNLYISTLNMFADAQTIFFDQKVLAKQFSFAAIRRLVTKDLAGIHFTIVDGITKKPLDTALVSTDETEQSLPVNKKGVLNLHMKVGVHSISVLVPGFDKYTGVVKVDAGVLHRVKIEMTKQTVEVPAKNEVEVAD